MIKEVSCLMIINDDNEILLQDRNGISKYGEEWSFFGGGIEIGETHLDAAKREAKEELNINLDNENIFYIGKVNNEIEKIGKKYIRYIYIIKTNKKESDFIDLEGAGAKFFPINKVIGLKFNTKIEEEIRLLKQNLS